MDRRAYLEGKFGGKDGAVGLCPVVEQPRAGRRSILKRCSRTPNTLNAIAIHWAGIEGRQTAAVSALFKAYFVMADMATAEVPGDIADGIEMDASV